MSNLYKFITLKINYIIFYSFFKYKNLLKLIEFGYNNGVPVNKYLGIEHLDTQGIDVSKRVNTSRYIGERCIR